MIVGALSGGKSYVVFGRATDNDATIDLDAMTSSQGFVLAKSGDNGRAGFSRFDSG